MADDQHTNSDIEGSIISGKVQADGDVVGRDKIVHNHTYESGSVHVEGGTTSSINTGTINNYGFSPYLLIAIMVIIVLLALIAYFVSPQVKPDSSLPIVTPVIFNSSNNKIQPTPQITTTASYRVIEFAHEPNSPVEQGKFVVLYGKGECSGGVRAVRFTVGGIPKAETSLNEANETWKTEEFLDGFHEVCFEVAGGPDSSWEEAARSCVIYEITK